MSEETNQKETTMTPQEMQEMRKKTLEYYRDQKVMLTAHCDVEELKARIKKAQLEAFDYSIKFMQLDLAMREAEDEIEDDAEESLKSKTE